MVNHKDPTLEKIDKIMSDVTTKSRVHLNYDKIKTFLNNHNNMSNGDRYLALVQLLARATHNQRNNFDEDAIKIFAGWGYRFEDFDFGSDNKLRSVAKEAVFKHKAMRVVNVIVVVVAFAFFPTLKIINGINASKENEATEKIKNCSSKLIHYSWTDENGCQKANFNSKSDCLWATFGKTYYYNQETYSYDKYYEYDYDSDLYGYNKSGVNRYKTSNIPADRGEYYIACSNDGSWHTNTFKSITEPVDYWESVKKDLF